VRPGSLGRSMLRPYKDGLSFARDLESCRLRRNAAAELPHSKLGAEKRASWFCGWRGRRSWFLG
jgi:hypothetical protein